MSSHRLVIYGGGVSAWIVAAAVGHAYSADHMEILVIEPNMDIHEPSIVDSALPSLRRFHSSLKLSEREFMKNTSATFKLGVKYCNWSANGHSFVHSFGDYGSMLDGVDFHQYAVLLHQCGDKTPFDTYSFAAQLVMSKRFGFPDKDMIEKGFGIHYSMHVDLQRYTNWMRAYAATKKVRTVTGELERVHFSSADKIQSIQLSSGELITGDFFFDCSGADALLIKQMDGNSIQSWREKIPTDKQVTIASNIERYGVRQSQLCTSVRANPHGWIKSVVLSDKQIHTLTFNSALTSDEVALQQLTYALDGYLLDEPIASSCEPGICKQYWKGNCLAIGAAAVNFPDLTFSYLHQVQGDVLRFLSLYSEKTHNYIAATEYNYLATAENERVLDYQQLNLFLCRLHTSGVWDFIHNMSISEALKHKLDLFRARGKLAFYEYETWMSGAWVSLLLGNQYWPERYDPLLHDGKLELVAGRLNQMRETYQQIAAQFPDEYAFLKKYTDINS